MTTSSRLKRAAQLALRGLELGERRRVVDQRRRRLDRGRLGARLDHLGERLLLEVGLALDGGDDVGDQVGAPLVLAQHFGPRRLHLLVERLEFVVAAARQAEHRGGREEGQRRAGATTGNSNRSIAVSPRVKPDYPTVRAQPAPRGAQDYRCVGDRRAVRPLFRRSTARPRRAFRWSSTRPIRASRSRPISARASASSTCARARTASSTSSTCRRPSAASA